MNIATPRNRDATFDPVMIKKRERILADSLTGRIIGLYAVGTSTREISRLMEQQFGNRISPETISSITDRVLPELQSWRNRTLDPVYPIVWMDGIHYKVMDEKNRRQVESRVEFTRTLPRREGGRPKANFPPGQSCDL